MAEQMRHRKLKDLKELPNNPRTIKSDSFNKLCRSIESNPDYFEARPIILSDRTGELVIIAGNQRYKAAIHLKMKEVPTYLMKGLSEDQEKEIIVRDNVANGEWDFDILKSDWDAEKLIEWGVEIPDFQDFSKKNKEIDTNEFSSQMTIFLTFDEERYHKVKDQLAEIASTPEMAIWKLLGNE